MRPLLFGGCVEVAEKKIVRFRFRYGQNNEEQFCCCWSQDYDRFGKEVAVDPTIIKGISDVPDEAMEDFKFNLQIANMKQELDEFMRVASSSCGIKEVKGGSIQLS